MKKQLLNLAYKQSQYLDLYLVEESNRPLVVCVHGGGFISGGKDDERCKQSATLLNDAGFNCASISYSLAPRENRFLMWPQNLFDVADSLVFLHDNANHYGYNFKQFGMLGFSAGCCLSNLYIQGGKKIFAHFKYETPMFKPSALVGFYGPYDFSSRQAERRSDNQEINLIHSPSYWFRQRETGDAPPVLHIQGDRDTVVDPGQHRMFKKDYDEKGFSFKAIMIKGFGHSFAPIDTNTDGTNINLQPDISRFLKRHLSGGSA